MAEFQIQDQPLPGVFMLDCSHVPDHRGDFTKFFNTDVLRRLGIAFTPAESFLTRSKVGVLRGMHFQVGEAAHDKLVTCIKGRVLDVVVDVRPESPTFNKPFAVELSQSSNAALLIGKGYAHGFFTLTDDSWLLYCTSTVHCPAMDRGVFWSSIAMDWPCKDPLLSERDKRHPSIHSLGIEALG
jgi:dTDP-4-dehydrorhamnose 3,5-epimerase